VFFARVWLLVDMDQPHKAHQTADTMATTFMPLSLHVSGHSLTDRVFPQEMSREVGAIRTTAFPSTACR